MMVKIYHDAHPRKARTSRGGSRGSRGGGVSGRSTRGGVTGRSTRGISGRSTRGGSSRNLTPPTPNPIDIRGEPEALALLSETLAEAGSSCDLKRFRDFPLPEPSSKRASLQEVRIMGYSYASCRSVYERFWEASVQAPDMNPRLLKVKRIRKKGSDRMIRPAVFSIVGLDSHDPVFVAELSRVMSRYSATVTQLPYHPRRTHARPSLQHNPASTRSRTTTGGTLQVYTLH